MNGRNGVSLASNGILSLSAQLTPTSHSLTSRASSCPARRSRRCSLIRWARSCPAGMSIAIADCRARSRPRSRSAPTPPAHRRRAPRLRKQGPAGQSSASSASAISSWRYIANRMPSSCGATLSSSSGSPAPGASSGSSIPGGSPSFGPEPAPIRRTQPRSGSRGSRDAFSAHHHPRHQVGHDGIRDRGP